MLLEAKKQEMKINEMGSIAHSMFPEIDAIIFKGSFRLGIRDALENCRFESWNEVSQQPVHVRKRFFESFLRKSIPYLEKTGVNKEAVDSITAELMKENEKYLRTNQEE